jgi:hypothetical protein
MKKLVTILALAIAIPTLVKAQGTVNFSSTSAAHVIREGGVAVVAGTATVGLYYGPSGTASNSLVLISPTVLNGAGGGISGGIRTTGTDVAGGSQATFQVRAWTGGFATYELAYAAALSDSSIRVGTSTIFLNATGNPLAEPPGTPANLTGWTTAIALAPVPEPSTIALGILGAGSLLFLRRKK